MKRFINIIKNNLRLITTFCSIGLVTAGLYFLLFSFFWKVEHINYNIAVTVSYIIAVTFYFFANRNLTFKAGSGMVRSQILKYICLLILNYVISIFIVNLLVKVLQTSPFLAVAFAIVSTTGVSFILSKYWIFKFQNNQVRI